jgi:hypothetical protein
MVDASEAIPEKGISLVKAFEYVFHTMTPNWQELENQLTDPAVQLRHLDGDVGRRKANGRAWVAYDDAQLNANKWLRSCIGKDLITAFIFFNGEPLQLPRQGWENAGCLESGIGSNFVGPDDPIDPGPDTEINGVRRPVYFVHSDLVALVEKAFGAAPDDPGGQFTGVSSDVAVDPATVTNKGGRPPEYDWEAMERFARSIIVKHGKPGRTNKMLPTQEDLVTLVLKDFGDRDLHPSASNVRKRVSRWLANID